MYNFHKIVQKTVSNKGEIIMTSFEKRKEDHLLAPENSVLTVIDYQPTQINSVNSMNRSELIRHTELVIKLANLYHVPIILSIVNVSNGWNTDTIPVLKKSCWTRRSFLRSLFNQCLGRCRIPSSCKSNRT